MITPKRPQVLADPLADTELELIAGVENIQFKNLMEDDLKDHTALTESRSPDEWKDWGIDKFASSTVGEYVGKLAIEQRRLLRVALLHAFKTAHDRHVTFRKRATVYALDHWGLEVIDQGVDPGGAVKNTVLPLVIVFVEPP